MIQSLSLCRAIMRLYSFCDFDIRTSSARIVGAQEVLVPYFKIESYLKSALDEVGIEMYPSGVCSCFDGQLKTVLEVFFIHSSCSLLIPDEILSCLSAQLEVLGRKPVRYVSQALYWAYSGRWIDRTNGHKFITDGLQMADNRILIDFLTYDIASHDCLHHRLIHELLHTLGIQEHEMDQFIFPLCGNSYELAKPFVRKAQEQISLVKKAFINSLQAFEANEPELTKYLISLADALCLYGFPQKMNCPLYTTTFMPAKLFPTPSISGYDVLFM